MRKKKRKSTWLLDFIVTWKVAGQSLERPQGGSSRNREGQLAVFCTPENETRKKKRKIDLTPWPYCETQGSGTKPRKTSGGKLEKETRATSSTLHTWKRNSKNETKIDLTPWLYYEMKGSETKDLGKLWHTTELLKTQSKKKHLNSLPLLSYDKV